VGFLGIGGVLRPQCEIHPSATIGWKVFQLECKIGLVMRKKVSKGCFMYGHSS
jgi:hypothetical protein